MPASMKRPRRAAPDMRPAAVRESVDLTEPAGPRGDAGTIEPSRPLTLQPHRGQERTTMKRSCACSQYSTRCKSGTGRHSVHDNQNTPIRIVIKLNGTPIRAYSQNV